MIFYQVELKSLNFGSNLLRKPVVKTWMNILKITSNLKKRMWFPLSRYGVCVYLLIIAVVMISPNKAIINKLKTKSRLLGH